MVLVGPSSSGKTTALRMVAGLEDITSGTLRMGGKTVNDLGPKDRNVAMVFQNYLPGGGRRPARQLGRGATGATSCAAPTAPIPPR